MPELRFQRQQNAQVAPRTLTMPPNAEGYFDGTGLFMPCRAQGPGRPLSYQLPYPPYSGLNVAMPGYVTRPLISGPPYQPGAPQRLPNSEMPQGYYSGATSFGAPPSGHDPRSRNDGMKHEARAKNVSSIPQNSNRNSTFLKHNSALVL